jgi:hypothetical protein
MSSPHLRPPAHHPAHEHPVEMRGPVPRKDGEINKYNVSRYEIFFHPAKTPPDSHAVRKSRRRHARIGDYPVVFVNGQEGSPDKHRAQACAVAAVSGGRVYGVYNASYAAGLKGVFGDTLQSVLDKVTSRVELTGWAELGKVMGWFCEEGDQTAVRLVYQRLRALNPATASLFWLLSRSQFTNARIVCHSQGNLIACNALSALMAIRDRDAVADMRVLAVASPTFFWGDAKPIVKVFNFANDAVGWLSGNFQLDGWSYKSGSGPLDAVARGVKVTTNSRTQDQMVTGYAPDRFNQLTHSFYIYLGELWDQLVGEFP